MSSPKDARGADAGADAALRAAVKPAVERVLREAPWTFNKTNPLKDACRAFLDAVADPGVAAPELARAATRALTLACASGKAAVCEPALGAARELVARGALAGTTQTWSPDMSQSRVKALAAAAALAASDDPPPGEPGSRGDAFDVSGSSEGNRTSRANDAARRTALVVAAAKCAETNEPRVHVAVIAASLAFATSDSFRLAGDALARVVRALLHVSVAAASREDRAAAKSALATLINAVFRRAEPHFSETTDDDSTTTRFRILPTTRFRILPTTRFRILPTTRFRILPTTRFRILPTPGRRTRLRTPLPLRLFVSPRRRPTRSCASWCCARSRLVPWNPAARRARRRTARVPKPPPRTFCVNFSRDRPRPRGW